MSNVLRLAIVDPNDSARESLKSMLLGLDSVWLEAESSRYEFFAEVVQQSSPDIAIVGVDHKPEQALQLVADLNSTVPECSILVVSSSTDGNLILHAMRSGAKEFLTAPVQIEELASALSRIADRRFGIGTSRSRASQAIVVAGATGGVGATSVAVNLGCALAANPKNSVALVDLDLALGDADLLLDAVPEYSVIDVAQNISRLDIALLKRSLTKHESGLFFLPRPMQIEEIGQLKAEDLQRVFSLLKATFSHLIIDLSKSFSALDMVALDMANEILLVTQLDVPCLRNVVRLLLALDERGLKDKVKIVVNRVGLNAGQISIKKAEETIGKEVFWQLPNDYRVMAEVRNNGVPLLQQAPRAAITSAISLLANNYSSHDLTISSEETAKDKPASKAGGWLKFLSGKSKVESK